MKKILLALALLLVPTVASAQCNGVFANNTFCGNVSGSQAPARQSPISSLPVGVVNTQSTSYTIQASDCSGVVAETGALQTITLPATTGFPANCVVYVSNVNSSRAQKLSGFPAAPQGNTIYNPANPASPLPAPCGSICLWPQVSTVVAISGNSWVYLVPPPSWDATGVTFNADPTGSDANDGLSNAAPLQHIQYAWNLISQRTTGQLRGIQLGCSATYNEALFLLGDIGAGATGIYITGNVGSPSSCVIDAGNADGLKCDDYCTTAISGVTIQNGLIGNIKALQHSTIDLSNVNIGKCGTVAGNQIITYDNSKININGPVTITSSTNCASLFLATLGGVLTLNGSTITLSGSPSYSDSVFNSLFAASILGPWTFSGSVGGGKQYDVTLNGILSAQGSSYPTGAAAGTTGTGGQVN